MTLRSIRTWQMYKLLEANSNIFLGSPPDLSMQGMGTLRSTGLQSTRVKQEQVGPRCEGGTPGA